MFGIDRLYKVGAKSDLNLGSKWLARCKGALIFGASFACAALSQPQQAAAQATSYPVTTQPISVCSVESMLYEELFNDRTNRGWADPRNGQNRNNPPVGFEEVTNNIGNADGTSTDATIDSSLNGGAGVASPSGGSFVSAFDNAGNPAFWINNASLGNLSAALGGAIYIEKWNWRPNANAAEIFASQDFAIFGSTGRLYYSGPDNSVALANGEWETIQVRLEDGPGWWFMEDAGQGNLRRRVARGGTIRDATPQDFIDVLSNVQSVGSAIEGIAAYAAGDVTPDTLAERYALDTVRIASCREEADLITLKTLTSGDDTPDEGDTITFQIAVTNNGPADATNVTLTDAIPSGLTATANNGTTDDGSGNAVGTYDAATGIWNIGSLANGDSATLTIEGTVDAGQGGNMIENITTRAVGDQADPDDSTDDLTESVSVNYPSVAYLPPNPAARCTANWYRWFTTQRLFNVTRTAVDPTNHSFAFRTTSMGANRWYMPSRNRSTEQLGIDSRSEPIESGGSTGEIFYGIINFQMEPGTNTVIPLRDPGLFEGHVFAAFDSSGAQIARYPTSAQFASNLRYIASFNYGSGQKNQNFDLYKPASWTDNNFIVPVPADGQVYVHYILIDETTSSRSGLSYCPQDVSDAPASYGIAAHNYDVALKIGTAKDVDIGVAGNAAANGDDLNGDGDSDEDGVTSFPALTTANSDYSVDVQVTNSGGADAALYGWIDFDGNGTFDAGELATIPVPAGTNNGTVTMNWTGLSGLAERATFARFRLTSDALTGAQAATTATDGEAEDYTVSITAPPDANLVTVKTLTSGDDTPDEGDTITFQIAVTNNGPADATNVTLTDAIPSGLTATANNGTTDDGSGNAVGTYDAATGIWNIGSLANGDSATLTIEGTVDAGQGGNMIENITTVASGDQPDPDDTGDTTTASVTVNRQADLSITKTNTPGENGEVDQSDDSVISGSSVTYTITVTNNGPDSTTGAVVTDATDSGLSCTGTDAVTITGDGIPAGSFTIADLAGAGIALGQLENGEAAVLTYSCEVD